MRRCGWSWAEFQAFPQDYLGALGRVLQEEAAASRRANQRRR